jgi:hypothetical protein
VRAAACTSFVSESEAGLVRLVRKPITVAHSRRAKTRTPPECQREMLPPGGVSGTLMVWAITEG